VRKGRALIKKRALASLISQKLKFPQELAPCLRRLPGFIGLVPPPALDKKVVLFGCRIPILFLTLMDSFIRVKDVIHIYWRSLNWRAL